MAQIAIRAYTNTGPDDPLLSLSASSTTNNQLIDETTVGSAIILQDTADWTSAICKHFILDGTAQDAHRCITYRTRPEFFRVALALDTAQDTIANRQLVT
jgi:hypothetical protein